MTFSEHMSHSEQYVLPLAVDVGIRLPLDLFSVLVSSILLGRLVESLKHELFMVIFIAVFGMGGVSYFFLDGIAELRRSNDIYNT